MRIIWKQTQSKRSPNFLNDDNNLELVSDENKLETKSKQRIPKFLSDRSNGELVTDENNLLTGSKLKAKDFFCILFKYFYKL